MSRGRVGRADGPTAARSLLASAGLATPMALRVAATLSLVERAGSAGATAERLAAETGTAAPVLRRVLDHLVTVGVFAFDEEGGRYRPTSLGDELRADAPSGIKALLDVNSAGGRAELDVGGGDGTVLAEILAVHPGVRGGVLDLPPTAAAAADRFAAAGMAERATAVPGSFFDPLPAGADAYLLCDVVHDWDDAHASRILDGCARAAGPHGTVVVVEPVLGRGVDTATDLFMLMCFGGRERTVDELVRLAAGSGLALRGSAEVADGRTLLEFGASADGA